MRLRLFPAGRVDLQGEVEYFVIPESGSTNCRNRFKGFGNFKDTCSENGIPKNSESPSHPRSSVLSDLPFNIVLVEPEIPPNTGNIARLCAATGSVLHLVEPLGFSLDDRYLKRAGLDYWESVNLKVWQGLDRFRAAFPRGRFFYLTTRSRNSYLAADFRPGDFIVFGKETRGLPPELLAAHPESAVTIPMPAGAVRSLNLSTSVGVVLYEALRKTGRIS